MERTTQTGRGRSASCQAEPLFDLGEKDGVFQVPSPQNGSHNCCPRGESLIPGRGTASKCRSWRGRNETRLCRRAQEPAEMAGRHDGVVRPKPRRGGRQPQPSPRRASCTCTPQKCARRVVVPVGPMLDPRSQDNATTRLAHGRQGRSLTVVRNARSDDRALSTIDRSDRRGRFAPPSP